MAAGLLRCGGFPIADCKTNNCPQNGKIFNLKIFILENFFRFFEK